ncbi:anion permease, partial [Aliarcobacter butzleri]|uniref:anion permease n=1 Tax=Aliarcobacter butzleri TaxID=28197 RepID=UPI003AEA03BC
TIFLAGSVGVMGTTTPDGTGPSPIGYGAGYISQAIWWGLGAIFGAPYLAVISLGAFSFI